MNQSTKPVPEVISLGTFNDEVSLVQLTKLVYGRRRFIILVTLIATSLAGLAAWLLPKTYTATITVTPAAESADSGQSGNLGSLVSQFSGLASLAGVSIGQGSKNAESIATLQSRALTATYIRQNNLLPLLFQSQWDPARNTWKHTLFGAPPTLWKGNEYIKENIRTISEDAKTGMVTLSIRWKDPATASKWANDLVAMTNSYLRNKAIAQSERNVKYLEEQAAKTDAVALREVIYSLLQSEINKSMLARGNDEYAFKVIDPAVPPEKPSSPNIVLWVLGGFFGSLTMSLFWVIARRR